jgi:hypothetical protein
MTEKKKLRITALDVEHVNEVLKRSGSSEVTIDKIKEDIKNGAPVNDDGSMHFVKYVAWLVKQ